MINIKINKIKKEDIFSPLGIFVIYILASAILIIAFRFFFPAETVPLARFSFSWRLTGGLLAFFRFFPALALSALIIPFGFKEQTHEKISPFSSKFFESHKMSIFAAITAAALYGLIYFLALPMVQNNEINIRSKSRLYLIAKEAAEEHSGNGNWQETARFLSICEQIWPNDPDEKMQKLKSDTGSKIEGERYVQMSRPDTAEEDYTWPEQTEDMTPAKAFEMAEAAMAEERYFDAHWLATLGGRLANENSPEKNTSNRIAGRAWDAMNSTEPGARESEAHMIFRMKRDGYQAFHGSEWIRAYYIFLELMDITPLDSDVQKYFVLSGNELKKVAFFRDEVDMTLGKITSGAVFSLPLNSGRMVMRISSLSVFSDYAYGLETELMAFDPEGSLLWSITAPYSKILPMTLDSGPAVSILLRALDRTNKDEQWGPELTGPALINPLSEERADFVLSISWDDFILLTNIRRGFSGLSLPELRRAANDLGSYGYQSRIFEMELLQRFARPLLLLPLGIFAIVIGWRYRAMKHSGFIKYPMLLILPVVIYSAEHFCNSWFNNLGIWAVISFGFTAASVIMGAVIMVLFILSLIILAAQHD